MKTFVLILRLIAGCEIGAMLGIFFAPDKNSNRRKPILNKGRDYAKEMKGKISCS